MVVQCARASGTTHKERKSVLLSDRLHRRVAIMFRSLKSIRQFCAIQFEAPIWMRSAFECLPVGQGRRSWRARGQLAFTPLAAILSTTVGLNANAQSLVDLYDNARAYDGRVLAAAAAANAAGYKEAQARGLRYPIVSLEPVVSRLTDSSPDGNPISSSTAAREVALTGAVTLYSKADDATIAQAAVEHQSAVVGLEESEQDLMMRVAQAYFDVLSAQDIVSASKINLLSISEQLALAKGSFDAGVAPITDVQEATARADLAASQDVEANSDLETKRFALNQLVNRPVLPRALRSDFSLPPAQDIRELMVQAETSPAVRKAELAVAYSDFEVTKANAANSPTVVLSARYGKGNSNTKGQQTATFLGQSFATPYGGSGSDSSSRIAVTLNIPIFAGFTIENKVRETVALQEEARANYVALRNATLLSVQQAATSERATLSQIVALRAAEASSSVALDSIRGGYELGLRVNLDVLNATTQLYISRRDLAKAKNDSIIYWLKIKQACGTISRESLAAISATSIH